MTSPAGRTGARAELRRGATVAAYCALSGSVAGLVWARLAPLPDVAAAFRIQPRASHQLVGFDVWFAGIAIVAGVLCTLVTVNLLGRRALGYGPVLGLAVGGGLAAAVADRVGYLANGGRAVEALGRMPALRHDTAGQLGQVASLLDFRVHMAGVLLIWPAAALAAFAVVAALAGEKARPDGVPRH